MKTPTAVLMCVLVCCVTVVSALLLYAAVEPPSATPPPPPEDRICAESASGTVSTDLGDVGSAPNTTVAALASAMRAYQTRLSVIANNLANAETTAFKCGRVILEDLPYRHEQMPGKPDTAGQYTTSGVSVGAGVRVAAVETDFCQGAVLQTDCELDVMVMGRGFFQVQDPSGETLYTRTGVLSKNANGNLVVVSANVGRLLQPPICIPDTATTIAISGEGIVQYHESGCSALTQAGQIELARFINPGGLLKEGEGLYSGTDASGSPTIGNPGADGIGFLHQGALEASNVDVQQELLRFRQTQQTLQSICKLLDLE